RVEGRGAVRVEADPVVREHLVRQRRVAAAGEGEHAHAGGGERRRDRVGLAARGGGARGVRRRVRRTAVRRERLALAPGVRGRQLGGGRQRSVRDEVGGCRF